MNRTSLLMLLPCLLFSDISYALRCGQSLIEIGDYKYKVYEKCGEPVSIERHFERRAVQNSASIAPNPYQNSLRFGQQQYSEIEISVEEWIYNFGRSRFQQFLRFENGVLTNITDLGRGH
jgi:hypothetical protein